MSHISKSGSVKEMHKRERQCGREVLYNGDRQLVVHWKNLNPTPHSSAFSSHGHGSVGKFYPVLLKRSTTLCFMMTLISFLVVLIASWLAMRNI